MAAQEGLPAAAAWTCKPGSLSGGGERWPGWVELEYGKACFEEMEQSKEAKGKVLAGCTDVERVGCRAGMA